jgi:hypothetical protein
MREGARMAAEGIRVVRSSKKTANGSRERWRSQATGRMALSQSIQREREGMRSR